MSQPNLKNSLSTFFFNKVFGKIAFTCVFFWFGRNIYSKFQVKEQIVEIQKNNIYADKEEISKKLQNSILKNTRFFFIFKYFYFPNAFIQFVIGSPQDPHLHYYKLLQYVKNKDGRLNLYFLSLDELTEDNKRIIKNVLNLKNENDIYKISHILSDRNGNYKPVFINNENLENSKRFLTGIQKIDSIDELNLLINKSTDETIHIISTGHKNIANKIVNKFFENSSLFSQSTLNFINFYPNFVDYLQKGRLVDKQEILILFNPKYYDLENLEQFKDLYAYDLKSRKILNFSDLKNNENILLAYKYKVNKDNDYDKELENFVDFIQFLIDPNNKRLDKFNLPKRFYITNNMDNANYYKLKFVNEKSKLLFVYININNLTKMKIDPNNSTKVFINILKRESDENSNFNYILTFNPNIAKNFNIFPKSNENLTIRFIDYGLIVKYDEKLNGDYSYIDLKNNSDLSKFNKNLLFYFKSTYNKKNINENELSEIIREFLQNDNREFLNNFPNILESVEISSNPDSKIHIINGNNFKQNFLDVPGKKLLFCVSDNCVGCSTIKHALETQTGEINEKYKFYLYDVMNETINFKKIKKVPLLMLYDGDKLIQEIDVNQNLNNLQSSYEEAVKELIENISKNNFKL